MRMLTHPNGTEWISDRLRRLSHNEERGGIVWGTRNSLVQETKGELQGPWAADLKQGIQLTGNLSGS